MPYKDIEKQRAYAREWRRNKGTPPTKEKNKQYRDAYQSKYPEKYAAQRYVANHVRARRWPKASIFLCAECDSHAQEYHHEDYTQPALVEPLCIPCHHKRHRTS